MPAHRALALSAALLAGCATAPPQLVCPAPRQAHVAALVRAADGDVGLLVMQVTERLSTQDVACWADGGDRPMALELARRLEAGEGLARDPERAEQLYARLGAFQSGTTYVYSPPVGKESGGRVIPIRTGPDIAGMPEAVYRRALMHLEGRAARPSYRRGLKLLRQAAGMGWEPARARLAAMEARRA